jgi:4-hydroxy-2-oxoheptanedioate aldolase
MDINYKIFELIKGEFEAEGLTRVDVAAEALFAARQGLDYLVKIGGAEAKSDLYYLADVGITSIVCPMVETEFAMQKYMEMLPQGVFEHIGVTIETVTAVSNIEKILENGNYLSDVTIGRTDLTASFNGASVESERTVDMVKAVARKSKADGLRVTMGGSITKKTRELLKADKELRELIDFVETRKVVICVERFLDDMVLIQALKLEEILLNRRLNEPRRTLDAADARLSAIRARA